MLFPESLAQVLMRSDKTWLNSRVSPFWQSPNPDRPSRNAAPHHHQQHDNRREALKKLAGRVWRVYHKPSPLMWVTREAREYVAERGVVIWGEGMRLWIG